MPPGTGGSVLLDGDVPHLPPVEAGDATACSAGKVRAEGGVRGVEGVEGVVSVEGIRDNRLSGTRVKMVVEIV